MITYTYAHMLIPERRTQKFAGILGADLSGFITSFLAGACCPATRMALPSAHTGDGKAAESCEAEGLAHENSVHTSTSAAQRKLKRLKDLASERAGG